ncbi:MAG: hypothetical protein K1X67_05830 [Fimbriimonadaceae bacterium]|nr:hypothetical protein [Fimbriimonadaceae bacterium]
MWKSVLSGARCASAAGAVGALTLVVIDLGLVTGGLASSFQSIWFGVPYFYLVSGTALVATSPFSVLGGAILGAIASRQKAPPAVALGLGSILGVIAVLGAFSLVFGFDVCLWSHLHCYEDPIGWLMYVGQREFIERHIYPTRLALSIVIAAILGTWVASRVWNPGSGNRTRQASA